MKFISPPLFLVLLFLGSGSAALAGNNNPCEALLNSRCQECHYKSRICQVLGQKSKGEWERTVNNMIRHGAKLSDAEKMGVIDCLYAAPVGADFVCKN